uniref:Uncharacterized protein n=1 Tax=Kalanchoe fedtschenkoi TaxID=63787 RepID=A0A7N0U2P4_KALFE
MVWFGDSHFTDRKPSIMASKDHPGLMPTKEAPAPGEPMSLHQHLIDSGAQLLQSLDPVKQMQQHVCTFATYSHDMTRQIETHHYITRPNEDFLQCAVYDSDEADARLLGVEYIVSDKIFETLEPEEQKLWHSHTYEIKAGLWVNPGVPEMVLMPELNTLAKSYGKFWCTWQVDRGDMLPMGPPALMMSLQDHELGQVQRNLIENRDNKYNLSRDALTQTRNEIQGPQGGVNRNADYWTKTGKGFVLEVEQAEIKAVAPFP